MAPGTKLKREKQPLPPPLPPEHRTVGPLVAEAIRRGYRVGRADLVHSIGSIAALAITVFVTIWVLFVLLRAGSGQGIYIAAGLAMLVLSPVLFLGGALLYEDQAARLRVRSLV